VRFQQQREANCHQGFFFLQGKATKEFHAILTETIARFLSGRAKDLSASLYVNYYMFLITDTVHLWDEYNKIYKMHGTYIKMFKL